MMIVACAFFDGASPSCLFDVDVVLFTMLMPDDADALFA